MASTMSARSPRSGDPRLFLYVAIGLVAGVAFVAFDVYSEVRIGAGTISAPHASVHLVVDHLVPLLVGPLLGVGAHYLQLRAQLMRAEERAQRADALRLRLQKVERDQAVWVLAAAVLHELNNPLHALRLVIEELEANSEDAAERNHLIARASNQAERAVSHLRRLRSMAGSAEPDLEPVDVHALLETLSEDLASLPGASGRSVAVTGNGPVFAQADRIHLRTILENLADNSLHALEGTVGGRIEFQVAREQDRAVVRVTDSGPGLEPRRAETLFEPLGSSKPLGLGLGLPVARALARAMRGDLVLEDPNVKRFRLELPLAAAGETADR